MSERNLLRSLYVWTADVTSVLVLWGVACCMRPMSCNNTMSQHCRATKDNSEYLKFNSDLFLLNWIEFYKGKEKRYVATSLYEFKDRG